MYKHFRFNSRTARQSILGMVVFPLSVFALAYNQDVRRAVFHSWPILTTVAVDEVGVDREAQDGVAGANCTCCRDVRMRGGILWRR